MTAIELLLATGSPPSASALRDLALRMPVRPRPQLAPETVLDALPDPAAEDHLEREEEQALQRQLCAIAQTDCFAPAPDDRPSRASML